MISPPTPATQAEQASGEAPAILHGRLLSVSRMATIGEMAAGVAHELNQPLTAIANYAHACDRILAAAHADPELREALRQITAQTVRAADIIRRLRALARSQQGERAAAAVNELIVELQDLLLTDARVHGAQLSFELAAQLPAVLVDAAQIQQVILNFVHNSLEALERVPGDRRQVVVRTSLQPQGEVEVAVVDSGPGITPEVAKRIFDPFFSTKENGTGLGLAISHTIARDHGGSVGYRANVPAGACIYLLLPAYDSEQAAATSTDDLCRGR
ncbi:MAG TPA: ATP-binding protein [Steroidobacteraceae bacterium]|nr:ATP-binding protein [Steroidobacteraceae bacterium]